VKAMRLNNTIRIASKQAIWVAVAMVVLMASDVAKSRAQTTVGGHVGVVFPLVTRADGQTTTLADGFSMGVPAGITVKSSGRTVFDMEFVSSIKNQPREVTLTVHPGLVWGVGHGFALGMRCLRDRFFGARIHAPGEQELAHQSKRQLLQGVFCGGRSAGPLQSASRRSGHGPSHLRHALRGGILRCVLCASCLPRVARALRSNQDFTFHHASEPRREELS